MFNALKKLIWGERLWATIIECREEINGKKIPHTLISVGHERRWVKGHIGKPGESILVNTKELNKY